MDNIVRHVMSRITAISCTTFTSHPRTDAEWLKLVQTNTNYHVFPYLPPSISSPWAGVTAILSDPAASRKKLIDVSITIDISVSSQNKINNSNETSNHQKLDVSIIPHQTQAVSCRVLISDRKICCVFAPANAKTHASQYRLPPQITSLTGQETCHFGTFVLKAGKDRIAFLFESELQNTSNMTHLLDSYLDCHIYSITSDVSAASRKIYISALLDKLRMYCIVHNKILVYASSMFVPHKNSVYTGGSFICQGSEIVASNKRSVYENSGNVKGFVDINKTIFTKNHSSVADILLRHQPYPLINIPLDCSHVVGNLRSLSQIPAILDKKQTLNPISPLQYPKYHMWWILKKFNNFKPFYLLINSNNLEEHNIKAIYILNSIAQQISKLKLKTPFGEDYSYSNILSRILRIIVVREIDIEQEQDEVELENCDSKVIQKVYRALKLSDLLHVVTTGTRSLKLSLKKLLFNELNASKYHFYTENEQYIKTLTEIVLESHLDQPTVFISNKFLRDINVKEVLPTDMNLLKNRNISDPQDTLQYPERKTLIRSLVANTVKKSRDPQEILFLLKNKFPREEDLRQVYEDTLRGLVALDMRNDSLTEYVMQKDWAQCKRDLDRMHRLTIFKKKFRNNQQQDPIFIFDDEENEVIVDENRTMQENMEADQMRLVKNKIQRIKERKKLDMRNCHACKLQLPLEYGKICAECNEFLCFDCLHPPSPQEEGKLQCSEGCMICNKSCNCLECTESRMRMVSNALQKECHVCKLNFFNSQTQKTLEEQIYYICNESSCRQVFCFRCCMRIEESESMRAEEVEIHNLSVANSGLWRCMKCTGRCECLVCKSGRHKSNTSTGKNTHKQNAKQTHARSKQNSTISPRRASSGNTRNVQDRGSTNMIEELTPPQAPTVSHSLPPSLQEAAARKPEQVPPKTTQLRSFESQVPNSSSSFSPKAKIPTKQPTIIQQTPVRKIAVARKWADEVDQEGQPQSQKKEQEKPLNTVLTQNNDKNPEASRWSTFTSQSRGDYRVIDTGQQQHTQEYDY